MDGHDNYAADADSEDDEDASDADDHDDNDGDNHDDKDDASNDDIDDANDHCSDDGAICKRLLTLFSPTPRSSLTNLNKLAPTFKVIGPTSILAFCRSTALLLDITDSIQGVFVRGWCLVQRKCLKL